MQMKLKHNQDKHQYLSLTRLTDAISLSEVVTSALIFTKTSCLGGMVTDVWSMFGLSNGE